MIAIELNSDSTVGELRELLGKVRNPQGMLRAVAKRAEGELKAHFYRRDLDSPNKLGGTRKHFWKAVGDSVTVGLSDARGEIFLAVTHPHFAQKVYGGVISVKRAQALTIPVTAEAYGKTTKEFEADTGLRLFLLRTRKGPTLAARVKGANNVKVQYLLKSSVTQSPDPRALPDMNELEEAIMETACNELSGKEENGR